MNNRYRPRIAVSFFILIAGMLSFGLHPPTAYAQSPNSICTDLVTVPNSNSTSDIRQSALNLQSLGATVHVVVIPIFKQYFSLPEYAQATCPSWYNTVNNKKVIKPNYIIIMLSLHGTDLQPVPAPELYIDIGSKYSVNAAEIKNTIDSYSRAGKGPEGIVKALNQIHDTISPPFPWGEYFIGGSIIAILVLLYLALRLLKKGFEKYSAKKVARQKAIEAKQKADEMVEETETILGNIRVLTSGGLGCFGSTIDA